MIKDIAYIFFIIEAILVAILIICWLLHKVWLFVNRTKNELTWYLDYLKFKREYTQWKQEAHMEQNTYKNGIMEYLKQINDDEILKKLYTVTKTYYEFLEENYGED